MSINRGLVFSLGLAICVILMGAFTRLEDAGLGCPDWPGCYGFVTVPTQAEHVQAAEAAFPERPVEAYKGWLEMIHRYIASGLGLTILLLMVHSLRQKKLGHKTQSKLATTLFALVCFQGALGAWTVTMKLLPQVVMAHLLGGFTVFSLLFLWWLRRQMSESSLQEPALKALAPLASLALVLLVGQIMLGGWTSANYAATACTELPMCEGNWRERLNFAEAFSLPSGEHDSYEFGVMDYSARMTVHISHRVGAVVVSLVLLLLGWRMLRACQNPLVRQAAWLMLALLVVQFGLGVSNIVWQLPLAVAVAHNGGAALLLLSLVLINYLSWRKA
ncbi:COX15/CtaA family protein [Paraferrimonas sedimenticola]|uniref:Cytochrome b561 n=1 Tax=Paraferrimonas sedimenticola TaxID=375674 RepID=A0AA37W155_9GAMM|nr:COX15/CtaA family protein [Paraferrimonas sedimenticola]GLP95952.1 cytochrome b561 [Paraferrimonas sedimenticola]